MNTCSIAHSDAGWSRSHPPHPLSLVDTINTLYDASEQQGRTLTRTGGKRSPEGTEGRRLIDLVKTVGTLLLKRNPLTTLETITTENHREAHRATSERTMTLDGQSTSRLTQPQSENRFCPSILSYCLPSRPAHSDRTDLNSASFSRLSASSRKSLAVMVKARLASEGSLSG